MDDIDREARLSRAFVALADTLTKDFDLVDLLQRLVDTCSELLESEAGGLMLVDDRGRLQLLASTSEAADFVELVQLGAAAGPCLDCFHSAEAVSVPDIAAQAALWPEFAAAAAAHGFQSVHATPMRLRDDVIGTMNLFGRDRQALGTADIRVAQALTDVATIGILQERLIRQSQVVTEQLQVALTSRVLIEQAKGVLAALAGLSTDDAFQAIRAHARRTNTPIRDVAARVVDRSLDVLADRR